MRAWRFLSTRAERGRPGAATALRRNVQYPRIVAHAAPPAPEAPSPLRKRCAPETGPWERKGSRRWNKQQKTSFDMALCKNPPQRVTNLSFDEPRMRDARRLHGERDTSIEQGGNVWKTFHAAAF